MPPERSRASRLRFARVATAASLLFAASRVGAAPAIRFGGAPQRNVTSHSDPVTNEWISRSDCVSDDVFQFPVVIDEGAGLVLEVWAGQGSVDCTQASTRTGSTALCLRVFGAPADFTALRVDVRAQDLAALESSSYGPNGQGSGTSAHCDPPSARTSGDSVTLYFLLITSSVVPVAETLWATRIDLVAPSPPTDITATNQDAALAVRWTPNPDPDVMGYDVLCDVAPPLGCAPARLVPGQATTTEFITPFLCGSVAGTRALTQAFPDGRRTVVSVLAFDRVGNVGPLSELACETPMHSVPPSSLTISGCNCSVRQASGGRDEFVALALFFGGTVLRRRCKALRG